MTTPKNPAAVALGRRGGRAKVSKGPNAAKTRSARKLPQPLPLPRHRPPLLEVDNADFQPLDILVPEPGEAVHALLADGWRFVRVSGGEKK